MMCNCNNRKKYKCIGYHIVNQLKNDHTLHFILIYLGVNEMSKNKYLSLGVASVVYYVMIKKEMKKNDENLPLFEYRNEHAIELKEIKCENA